MDDLTYSLRQLCRRNRDGSHATQADRQGILTLASRHLRAAGILNMRATSLKEKHVEALLKRWQAFGLRREECIKFQPRYADRGDCIALKDSWAKGGRPRTVPITTPEQRTVLDAVHELAGAGSLIPPHKNFIQQRQTYDGQCKAAGLSRMHGLRHRYAQMRYEALTGWKAPAAGGPSVKSLTPAQRAQDAMARQTISRELGHERASVVSVYLG
jgi:hypothetical protein